jgi:hypothetical protein
VCGETGRLVENGHNDTCLSSSAPSIIKQEEQTADANTEKKKGDTIMAPVTQEEAE